MLNFIYLIFHILYFFFEKLIPCGQPATTWQLHYDGLGWHTPVAAAQAQDSCKALDAAGQIPR